MSAEMIPLLQAVTATAAFANGLFFLRFWRDSRDRFFGWFGVSFWMLALSWFLLAVFNPEGDPRAYVYAIRLVAFLLLILAILDKNRR